MQVKTKNLVVGVLVAAFVGLVWYQFVYSPLEAKASKARNATHEADNTAAKLRHQLADAATAKKNAKTHDPSPSVMSEAVPADAAEASFLRSVDAFARHLGRRLAIDHPDRARADRHLLVDQRRDHGAGHPGSAVAVRDRPRGAQAHLRHRQPLADGRNLGLVGVVVGPERGSGAPADADLGSHLQPARRGRGDDGCRGHRDGYGCDTGEGRGGADRPDGAGRDAEQLTIAGEVLP